MSLKNVSCDELNTDFCEFEPKKSLIYFQHSFDHSIKRKILLQLGAVHVVIILGNEVVVIPGDKVVSSVLLCDFLILIYMYLIPEILFVDLSIKFKSKFFCFSLFEL